MRAPEHENGLAQMEIDGRLVTFDTVLFSDTAGRPAVLIHFDGRITVGPVEYGEVPNWYGARSAWEPWTPTGRGGETSRRVVTVLGVVVDERPAK